MKPVQKLCAKTLVVIGGASRGVEIVTLFFTFVAVMTWVFLCAQTLIGRQSIWWLVVGPALIIAFEVIREVGWEARHELARQPIVRVLGALVGLLRDVLALLAIVYLAQAIRRAIAESGGLTPWEALWQILTGG
jgi:hypothetical protein